MADINFPLSPSLNDEYTFDGRIWQWNGVGWRVKAYVAPLGATGATGVQGATGATGVVGVSGATGATGVIGVSGATGVVGVSGATGATGVVGVSGATGVQGIAGPTGATGVVGVSGATGVVGVSGATGATGVVGVSGATGVRNGIRYAFSTTVTDADPGAGTLRYNNAVIGSVTQLFIDDVDTNNVNQTAWFATWDDSTNTSKGYVTIQSALSPGTVSNVFLVTSVTAATGYYKIGVTFVSGTLPANADALVVDFTRTGDVGVTGATGVVGVSGATGVAGPTGATGATGVVGVSGATGATGVVGVSGATGATGVVGVSGATGVVGVSGATGVRSGVRYAFSTTITDADPGAGTLRYNNAAIASVTQIFIDDVDANSTNQTAWFATWDDSTNTSKGYVSIQSALSTSSSSNLFLVTAVTAATGYYKITVTYVSGSLPANAEALVVVFGRTGDVGVTGATGVVGVTGATGVVGVSGATGATGVIGVSGATGVTGATGVNGLKGGSTDLVFFENDQTVTTSYTLTTNKNAVSAGPITINSGATVTVPSGASWVIV